VIQVVLLLGSLLFSMPLRAKSEEVRGRFRVEDITSLGQNLGFQVTWLADDQKIKQQRLILVTDNVHLAVKPGLTFSVVAEIRTEKLDREANIVQMLLLQNGSSLTSPVWLQSKIYPPSELKAASYLEMHAPATDYMVL